jgi:hypothetical protein
MNFQAHLQILAAELQPNGLTIIDARALDGTTMTIILRVVEPLAVGGHLALTLTGEPAAAGPTATAALRARMQGIGAPGQASRSMTTGGAASSTSAASSAGVASSTGVASSANAVSSTGAAGSTGAASRMSAADNASAASSPPRDASSLLLSTILGAVPPSSASVERDVNDEMDALFGAPRKG